MANRRQLVKRRKTVRNIQKITRTMQLIATARFQKALSRATATKPYANKLAEMVAATSRGVSVADYPLLAENDGNRSAMIVITSNRGLCGGYNANVLRTAHAEVKSRRAAGEVVDIHATGKKGINYLRFLGEQIATAVDDIDDSPRFDQVSPIADAMMDAYRKGEVASVDVCYMRFKSAGSQQPDIMRLLPIESSQETAAVDEAAAAGNADGAAQGSPTSLGEYDYSPEPADLLAELLPATVRMRLFTCFTDAAVSEQVARMVAMKAATDAADDMITLLTRQYNRARQTAITMELLDIIGGAAAIS